MEDHYLSHPQMMLNAWWWIVSISSNVSNCNACFMDFGEATIRLRCKPTKPKKHIQFVT